MESPLMGGEIEKGRGEGRNQSRACSMSCISKEGKGTLRPLSKKGKKKERLLAFALPPVHMWAMSNFEGGGKGVKFLLQGGLQ